MASRVFQASTGTCCRQMKKDGERMEKVVLMFPIYVLARQLNE